LQGFGRKEDLEQTIYNVRNMKDIIIVGAGHLGLDVYDLIKSINKVEPLWHIKGFLNDFPIDVEKYQIEEKVIGTIKDWMPSTGEHFALAIGSPIEKEKIVTLLQSKGAKFETLISPYALVSKTAQIGEGSIILPTSKIGRCARIGRFVCIGDTTMSHQSSIGDYSNTASYVNIYQDIKVGKRVQIWSHAVILNNVEDDAIIGAGSIVINKVKKGNKVFGNPAKKIDL